MVESLCWSDLSARAALRGCLCLVRIPRSRSSIRDGLILMWYFADASNMNRQPIQMRHCLAVSTLFVVGMLAFPCGAQTPSPAPPVQNQAVQLPQATPSAGVSGQANVEPTSGESSGDGSTTSSSAGKRFGSAGQGLPGMLGGPPIKGSMGYQDPSSRYMRPPVIPPLLCDPAVNIPC